MKSNATNDDLSIGELAGRFGLATHVLRHWETMGLLSPAARINGRRRYGREHVFRVAMILRGKEAGFGLERLRELFTAPNGPTRRSLLERHRAELDSRIVQAQAQKELIEHVLGCPAEDFVQCPNFQQLVLQVEDRVPMHRPTEPEPWRHRRGAGGHDGQEEVRT